jgi:hypothetical protein
MSRQIFLAYVCITSDAERDQKSKIKISKIEKSKIAKTKKTENQNREFSKFENRNETFRRLEKVKDEVVGRSVQEFAALKR